MSKIPIPGEDPSNHYIYNPETHEVKRHVGSLTDWFRIMDGATNKIMDSHVGGVHISTVFLGFDHSFGRSDNPILFETMCFGGGPEYDGYQVRCHTYEEAIKGHEKILGIVSNELPLNRRPLKLKFRK